MKVFIILGVILWSGLGSANVDVNIAGQSYGYIGNPRLIEILQPIAQKQNWYWAGASVFKLDTKEIDSKRNELIEQLTKLGLQDRDNTSSYQKIIVRLQSLQLFNRIDIAIDYELARIQLRSNPAFADGRYFIDLSTRPTKVHVEGAVSSNTILEYSENTCLSDYLDKVSILDIASQDFIYVIQPNGNIFSSGIAYWNKQCVLLMPGSQIYVPLAESPLFSDISTFNQSVAKLLSNRIIKK